MARLLDDQDALSWLGHEVQGYVAEEGNVLGPEAWAAATRSNRVQRDAKDGSLRANTTLVGELEATIESAHDHITAAADPAVSISSANPNQFVSAPGGNAVERVGARRTLIASQAVLDKVLGSIHSYVGGKYQELRFGAAVEGAFEVVRRDVDAAISALIPDALPKLNAAMENLTSDNPEHWAQAAATCRRMLKAAADALRPPGEDVDGRQMGDAQYINRLVDWIQKKSSSETLADSVGGDLEYLGRRLDAVDDAGHKGAHSEVDRWDAARFLTGTYLLLGDILRLSGSSNSGQVEPPAQ